MYDRSSVQKLAYSVQDNAYFFFLVNFDNILIQNSVIKIHNINICFDGSTHIKYRDIIMYTPYFNKL